MRIGYWIYRALAHVGAIRELPTTSLYLINPIAMGQPPLLQSLSYEGANVFRLGGAQVVVRSTAPRNLQGNGAATVYVIDDHLGLGIEDETLPSAYRQRLTAIWENQHPAIVEWASDIVVPNVRLAEFYDGLPGQRRVHFIDPVYSAHNPGPARAGKRVVIGLLLTRSHQADIAQVAPEIVGAMDGATAELIHCLAGTDLGFADGPQVQAHKPMPWRRYQRWRPHVDIGLYPLRDTPFNRHRSINKLVEYVHLGAAPLVSDVPAMRDVPKDLKVADDAWRQRTSELVHDPGRRRACWEIANDFLHGRDPLNKAATLWSRLASASGQP